jgi:hypothetical protein
MARFYHITTILITLKSKLISENKSKVNEKLQSYREQQARQSKATCSSSLGKARFIGHTQRTGNVWQNRKFAIL